ncbi:MAG: Wadjet anti-phage system protein JetD domain-containing protein [Bilifractor sp.]
MKRYDERALRLLLDRYERSALSDGTNTRNIYITVKVTKKNFPEYFDESSSAYIEIHEQLEELEQKGYISLTWKDRKPGHILESITLITEKTEEIYTLLHREPKAQKEKQMLALLEQYEDRLPVFTGWCAGRIRQGLSVRQYADLDHPENTERVLRLCAAILENREEVYLRAFSIRVFHDSKVAESELNLAASILRRFECREDAGQRQELTPDAVRIQASEGAPERSTLGRTSKGLETHVPGGDHAQMPDRKSGSTIDLRLPEDLETDEVLQEFGIYRNPSYVFIKGYGISEKWKEGIGIFQDDLENLSFSTMDGADPDVILTIENLTSYHQWDPQLHTLGARELVIYLAGYANHVKRELLERMHEDCPDAAFFHFGDTDCGGFRIWKHLSQETGISIRTFGMDLPTYEKYRDYGKPLTAGDCSRLAQMLADPFFSGQTDLFQAMLHDNRKIEQECMDQRCIHI